MSQSFSDVEAIRVIQQTAVTASGAAGKVQFVALPGEPSHVYASVDPDGAWGRHVAEPQPRCHALATLFEAIAYANVKGGEDTVIWFDEEQLVVVLDDKTRRDRAVLTFNDSPQFARLFEIDAGRETFKQAAFRRLLRVDFAGCTPNNLLLNWISNCKFGNQGSAAGMIAKDKSSFGRDIEQSVSSASGEECPDEITLSMPVTDDPGLQTDRVIHCDVEVLLAEEKFVLTPFPGELKRAVDAELANIEALLAGTNGVKCPVFRGRP